VETVPRLSLSVQRLWRCDDPGQNIHRELVGSFPAQSVRDAGVVADVRVDRRRLYVWAKETSWRKGYARQQCVYEVPYREEISAQPETSP